MPHLWAPGTGAQWLPPRKPEPGRCLSCGTDRSQAGRGGLSCVGGRPAQGWPLVRKGVRAPVRAPTAAVCSRTAVPRELTATWRTLSLRSRRPCRSSPAASCSGGSTPGPPTPLRSVLPTAAPPCPAPRPLSRRQQSSMNLRGLPVPGSVSSAAHRGHGGVLAHGRHVSVRASVSQLPGLPPGRGGPRTHARPPRPHPLHLTKGVSRPVWGDCSADVSI